MVILGCGDPAIPAGSQAAEGAVTTYDSLAAGFTAVTLREETRLWPQKLPALTLGKLRARPAPAGTGEEAGLAQDNFHRAVADPAGCASGQRSSRGPRAIEARHPRSTPRPNISWCRSRGPGHAAPATIGRAGLVVGIPRPPAGRHSAVASRGAALHDGRRRQSDGRAGSRQRLTTGRSLCQIDTAGPDSTDSRSAKASLLIPDASTEGLG